MNIVSLAFFRHDRSVYEQAASGPLQGIFFNSFLGSLIRAHHAVWRDWELVIHHDDRVRSLPYFSTLERMQDKGLLMLTRVGEAETLCGGMLWRLLPLFSEESDLVVCRDIDSLPMERDFRMVAAFAAHPHAAVHAIHDSESHSGPLMGGMIAFKAHAFRGSIAKEYSSTLVQWKERLAEHGADQQFLNQVIYPLMKDRLLLHTRRSVAGCECLRAYQVFPQETALDRVVTHIGAGYDVAKAMSVLEHMDYPNKSLIEECERTPSAP